MRTFRVSVRGLMLFVCVVSIGLAALRFSTPIVAGIVVQSTLLGFGLSILAAIAFREGRRAFWIGFNVLGWGYLAVALGSAWVYPEMTLVAGKGSRGGGRGVPHLEPTTPQQLLATSMLLEAVRPSLQASNHSGVPSLRVTSLLGGTDARSRAILNQLDLPLSMPFANETPFEEVLKYIRIATSGPGLPEGIPIYVDPIGLQEAEKTMDSTIILNLEGVPLRKSLSLMLRELDLVYLVDDGLLTITSRADLTRAEAARAESFRRVGHCLFALIFALIGGFAASILHRTRPTALSAPTSIQL